MTAPTPPEVREAAVLEEVARAMYATALQRVRSAVRADVGPADDSAWDLAPDVATDWYRAVAAAAVAAYRATGGGAEEAVRRVEAVHVPYGIYHECGHNHSEDDEGVVDVDEVGLVCDDGLMYRVCQHCCTTGKHFYDYQTEDCVTEHTHGKDEPLCPTMAAIAGESR